MRYNVRPVRIFASLVARNLGDFAGQNIAAASTKALFDSASLLVEVKGLTNVHRKILEYNTHIDHRLELPPKSYIPTSVFDIYAGALDINSDEWNHFNGRYSNVFSMGLNVGTESIPSLPYKARFTYPAERIDSSRKTLVDMGLDPERWFTAIHWREPGYPGRPDEELRDIKNVCTYIETIRHITKEQGGQVVRMGHPGSSKLPDDLQNVVDLSTLPDSFDLQCFAISRARYFLGSCSGPNVLGSSFGTPSLITNQLGPDAVWNPGDICLTQTVQTGDGRRLTGEQFFRAGLLDHGLLKRMRRDPNENIEIFQNTSEEIIRCADLMYQRTSDCEGWRVPDPIGKLPVKRPNFMPQPLSASFDVSLFSDNQ